MFTNILKLFSRRMTIDSKDLGKSLDGKNFVLSCFKCKNVSDNRSKSFDYIDEKFFNNKLTENFENLTPLSDHLIRINSPLDNLTTFLFGFGDHLNMVGEGTRFMKKNNLRKFSIDSSLSPYRSGLTASLAWYEYKKFDNDMKFKPQISPFLKHIEDDEIKENFKKSFYSGLTDGRFQNVARYLAELAPNILRPNTFMEIVKEIAQNLNCSDGLKMTYYDKKWCDDNKMIGLQAVGKGSQNYGLLEMEYNGNPQSPDEYIVLVGKGVTFDTGGISLKPGEAMSLMKGDMGGSAVATASNLYLANSQLPINVKTLIPLVENSPDGNAILPGSVITYSNEKKVEIINTDAEGRLVLADALLHSQNAYKSKPSLIIDLATLTGAITISLGDKFSGCFANQRAMSLDLKNIFNKDAPANQCQYRDTISAQIDRLGHRHSIFGCMLNSSTYTGDAFWPMPLSGFHDDIKGTVVADIVNAVENKGRGGSSHAAVFLDNFVDQSIPWIHLDIASVFYNASPNPIYSKGMTG